MKYTVDVITTFVKTITIEADTQDQAEEKAWSWVEDNDELHNASVETTLELFEDEPSNLYTLSKE